MAAATSACYPVSAPVPAILDLDRVTDVMCVGRASSIACGGSTDAWDGREQRGHAGRANSLRNPRLRRSQRQNDRPGPHSRPPFLLLGLAPYLALYLLPTRHAPPSALLTFRALVLAARALTLVLALAQLFEGEKHRDYHSAAAAYHTPMSTGGLSGPTTLAKRKHQITDVLHNVRKPPTPFPVLYCLLVFFMAVVFLLSVLQRSSSLVAICPRFLLSLWLRRAFSVWSARCRRLDGCVGLWARSTHGFARK
eukprot:386530-Rhodomonas_salina.1